MQSVTVFLFAVVVCVACQSHEAREERLVRIAQGPVRGYKEPEYDIFTFYGIPYATTPKGKNKFKAPLPAPSWKDTFEAVNDNIACPQVVIPDVIGKNAVVQEDCLVANVYVPDTKENNLPVAVYIHGGAFQIGRGSFYTAKTITSKKKFILITFNYRLGVHGFLCLGTENAPGNAGMKDQVALLRWVKNNIESFGGNPSDVTIWGSSAGAASVELLMLSPLTKGLFNKAIPESSSSLAAYAVQADPMAYAKEFAIQNNFTAVDSVYALEHFYMSATYQTLFKDIIDRKDSTFLFTPCVEIKTEQDSFLEESPFDILKSGNYDKVPLLYGFSNMEGMMRMAYFEIWIDSMNENFTDFITPNINFKNDYEKEAISKEIKKFYFGDGSITRTQVLSYIEYFSDVVFRYPTLKSINLHVNAGHDKIYFYEYSYINENDPVNSPAIPYTENVRGAGHCAQSAAILDGLGFFKVNEDALPEELQNVKAYIRELWINFITTGSPVPAGSALPVWPPVEKATGAPHMSLGRAMELRGALLERPARFWDDVYTGRYRAPQPPPAPTARHTDL